MTAYNKQKILIIPIMLLFAFATNASAGAKELVQQIKQKDEYREE